MPKDNATALTVYYDGACPLCRAEISHYARCDGADGIDFVDASDPDQPLGRDLERNAALGRFHVRRADGRLVSGAQGFAAIWSVLPRWRWMARLSRVPGALWVMEMAYRAFLPVRPALSRLFGRLSRRSHK